MYLSGATSAFTFSPGASVSISVLVVHTCCLRLGFNGAHVTFKPASVDWQRLLFLLIASEALYNSRKHALQSFARYILLPWELPSDSEG